MPATTLDALLEGALLLEQPAPGHGYRVNVDSLWLARFAANCPNQSDHVVDLGAGVGAVALALHTLSPILELTLVENDPAIADLARKNAHRSGLGDRTQVVVNDVQSFSHTWPKDAPCLVVANPPYTPPGSGRRGPEASRDAARRGNLRPFIAAMARLLTHDRSRACLCYPVSNLLDALAMAQELGLTASRLRFVHPGPDRPARLALIELSRSDAGGPLVQAPWLDSDPTS
jgi:tRNA1(Val) A37 N6-methylase TrmN6